MPAPIVFNEDQIYNLFVVEGLTKVKISEMLGVTRSTLQKFIESKGWVQTDDAIKRNRARPNKFKVNVDRDVLIELYINQNKTVEEVSDSLGISQRIIQRRLSELNIFKPKRLIIENANRIFKKNHPDGWSDPKIIQKRQNTCLKKYGVKTSVESPEVKEKIRQTCLKKFGFPTSLQSPDVREKGRNARRKSIYLKNENVQSDKILEVTANRDVFRNFIKQNNIKTCRQLSENLGISIVTAQRLVNTFYCWDIINRFKSKPEIELGEFLKSIGVNCRSRKDIIPPYEIDLYDDVTKIGVEFNGTYWHCDLVKPPKYHQKKSQMAQEVGVKLIHIYEYEWADERIQPIIKSMLKIAFGKVENRIYARNCEIKEITNKEAKPFNEANHLQGHKNAQITYGLFYKDELVQLMSFSFNKKQNWWEIERGCPGSNNIVVGGVSKLFKHFIKIHNPDKIFSYCDYNKFDGSGYEKIGMKYIGLTKPDMKWVIDGEVYNRNPSKHKEFQNKAEAKIFGSGSKKYLWVKNN